MTTALVVASNRPKDIVAFLDAWSPHPWDFTVVVEDRDDRSFELGRFAHLRHLCWKDIIDKVGEDGFEAFSRRDSGIKCFGFHDAVSQGADLVVVLDDDCYPADEDRAYFLRGHEHALAYGPAWVPSIAGMPTRGLPYQNLGHTDLGSINMGLWRNVADFDAPQSLHLTRTDAGTLSGFVPPPGSRLMHPDNYWPFCAMNFSFLAPALPLLYFPRQGDGVPFRRFDDIWCGVLMQKAARHLGLRLSVGEPHVVHTRASVVMDNLVKEAPGIAANEKFWRLIDRVEIDKAMDTPALAMAAIAEHLNSDDLDYVRGTPLHGYAKDLGRWIDTWLSLVSP